ncbi:MAG TPA: amidohydrolase, partial [Pseudonocardiaceae bacterium]|nr:amidohydrolase [Pseudonocardiaceae bacterium]
MLLAATATGLALAVPASAAPAPDTNLASKLVKSVSGENAHRHQRAFQRIADANGGTRAADTPGYDASVEYVAGKLRGAGFQVSTPSFNYEATVYDAERITAAGVNYRLWMMAYSPQTPVGGITAPTAAAREDADPGCTADDFAGSDFTGKVALVRRG